MQICGSVVVQMLPPIWHSADCMTGNGLIELLKVTEYNFQPSRARLNSFIISSSGSPNQHSAFVLCDRSLNPHNALHRRALNLTP